MGRDCVLKLPPTLRHAVCGYRVLVRSAGLKVGWFATQEYGVIQIGR